jgi:4-hydroxy-tetrahydrodipicolinate synthase
MLAKWNGVFAAIWTPTDGALQLQKDALAAHARFLRSAGVDGLMVLGSTGEFPHFDIAQRKKILEALVEAVPGCPLIVNCSDVNPGRVAELGRHARMIGADAIALLPPWFFSSTPEDVVEFMARGAEAADLPLVIYNFPERVGHAISAESVAAICARARVVGLKQSGDDFARHAEFAELGAQKGFVVFTGSDTRIPEAYAMGARGVISGYTNAIPEWISAAFHAAQQGDAASAEDFTNRIREFAKCFSALEFPVNVAAALDARGRPVGQMKMALSAKTVGAMSDATARARVFLADSGLI